MSVVAEPKLLTEEPVPLAIGNRCVFCKHWGRTPSRTAPAQWQRCGKLNCDRSPGGSCPLFERRADGNACRVGTRRRF